MNTKFRLVTCPRCRHVLPEWPHIPVYKCGGCSALLQAKNWKDYINGRELSSGKTDSSGKNVNDPVSDGLNQKAMVLYAESPPESDTKGNQTETGNGDTEECGGSNSSAGRPRSTKLCNLGNGKLCLEVNDCIEQGENRYPLGQDGREYGNMSLDCNRDHDQSRDRNCSDELPCPYKLNCANEESSKQTTETLEQDEGGLPLKNRGENEKESRDRCSEGTGHGKLPRSAQLACHMIEISSPGGTGCNELGRENDVLEPFKRKDQDEHRDQYSKGIAGDASLVKTPSLSEGIHHQSEQYTGIKADAEGDESKYLPQQNNDRNQPTLTGKTEVSSDGASYSRGVSSSTLVACCKVEKSSMGDDANLDMDESQMNNFQTLDVECSLSPKEGKSIIAARNPPSESILSQNISPHNKRLGQSHNEVQYIDRVRSVDTSESLPFNARTELGSTSKVPKRMHHANDAGVTASERTDDELSVRYSHLYERKFKATGSLSSNRWSRKDSYGVEKTLEMHHQPKRSSSLFIGKKTLGTTGEDWRPDELLEPRRHDHGIRSRTQLDKHDPVSRMPYNLRSLQLVHGNGSHSNYQQNVYQQHSGFSPRDATVHGELEKMQLLRMVYELKDKLKQTHISKKTANGRFSGKHWHEKQHPGNYTPQHSKIPIMSFLGKAAHCRCQVRRSCSHCCHQDCQCSTQLPPHVILCCDCRYVNHHTHGCCNAFPSCSWSPQQHINSEFSSLGRETKGNNRKHKQHKPDRLHKGEKHSVAKRHLMPIAAGSPIIACCHCSELLQLPVDFPISKRRRFYRLRCNSCSRILKFYLQNRSNLVPYVHDAPVPPPSKMDDNHGAVGL